jgi:hypothetical protein
VEAEELAKADRLPEADPLELVQVVVALAPERRQLQADPVDPLEADLPERDPDLEDLPLAAEDLAAVAARTPSSIPRMAKFPTRRPLARNPTP